MRIPTIAVIALLLLLPVPKQTSWVVAADAPPADTAAGWAKHGTGPVLGGKLGTCFDVAVLREEGGRYRMWFSWRPRKSIALVESADGVTWSDPLVVLEPAQTGWEDDVNRPAVVRRGDGGSYHMWYTGQREIAAVLGRSIAFVCQALKKAGR